MYTDLHTAQYIYTYPLVSLRFFCSVPHIEALWVHRSQLMTPEPLSCFAKLGVLSTDLLNDQHFHVLYTVVFALEVFGHKSLSPPAAVLSHSRVNPTRT